MDDEEKIGVYEMKIMTIAALVALTALSPIEGLYYFSYIGDRASYDTLHSAVNSPLYFWCLISAMIVVFGNLYLEIKEHGKKEKIIPYRVWKGPGEPKFKAK